MITRSIVFSKLDYCNAVLYGVSDHNINRFQRVQNNLARVVCTAPYRTSVIRLRRSLRWLPIRERITYKISVMTYKIRSLRKPAYLDELIIESTRSLRSSDKVLLTEPRTITMIASRAFGVAAPRTWNGLPLKVRTAPEQRERVIVSRLIRPALSIYNSRFYSHTWN